MSWLSAGTNSVVKGVKSIWSGYSGATAAMDRAKQAQGYESEMSNTAMQRRVVDLRKAGLNPMLAYQLGGASTPEVGQATPTMSPAEGISSAVQGFKSLKESGLLSAQMDNMRASTDKTTAEAALVRAQIPYADQLAHGNADISSHSAANLEQQGANLRAEFTKLSNEIHEIMMNSDLTELNIKQKRDLYPLLKRAQDLQNAADALKLPGLKNEAAAQDTWWKKNIAPYLKDVDGILGNLGAGAVGGALIRGMRGRPPAKEDNRTRGYRIQDSFDE